MSGQLTGNAQEDEETSSQDKANVIAVSLAAPIQERTSPRQKRARTQPVSLLSETSLPTEWTSSVYGQDVGKQGNLVPKAHALNFDNSVAVPWSAPSELIGASSVNVGSIEQATEYVPTQNQPVLSSPVTSVGISGIDNVGNDELRSGETLVTSPRLGMCTSAGNRGLRDSMSSVAANIVSSQRRTPSSPRMIFNMEFKGKGPPSFSGKVEEDVDSWLAKIEDFIYLTEVNKRQQVAYMATLLEDAAGDWWNALLKERHGSRPVDFAEMSALLRKRFGSSTRVDRARAALRNVRQSRNENVRAYSNRFESLLARLPTFDAEWAKSQYVWGLNQKIAELVVIAEPADLQAAIRKAEKIDMARGMVADNQGQSFGGWFRSSRGRFTRGRGRMASVQHAAGPSTYSSGQGHQQHGGVQYQSGQQGPRPNLNNVQCFKCQGWGHRYYQCPSKIAVQYDGDISNGDQTMQKRMKTAQYGTSMQCEQSKITTEISQYMPP